MELSDIAPCLWCGSRYPSPHAEGCQVGRLFGEFSRTDPGAVAPTLSDILEAAAALESRP